jgi:PAS domain S-box-containing protein
MCQTVVMLAETLSALTDVVVLLLAGFSVLRWRQRGGEPAGWVALAFTSLALTLVLGRLVPEGSATLVARALDQVALGCLLAFPYLLFRFATSFRSASHRLDRVVAAAAAALVAWAVLLPQPGGEIARGGWSGAFVVTAIVYWTAVSAAVAVQLWRGGTGQPAVARSRMRLLSVASLVLSAAILLAGASTGERSTRLSAAVHSTALVSCLLFLAGFVPPPALRRLSRRTATVALRRGAGQLVRATRPDEVLAYLLPQVVELVGGRGAAITDPHGRTLAAHGDLPDETGDQPDAPGVIRLELSVGSLRVWSSAYMPFFGDEEVEIVGFLGTLADLALERTRAGERAAWLAAVVDSSDDAIVGTDLEGTIVSWNSGAERLFGRPATDMVGRPAGRLIPPGRPDDLAAALERLGHGGRPERYETLRVRADGTAVEVALTLSATRDTTGAIAGASTIARDISERKRLEADLSAARDDALEAARLKSEFLAIMSHEIRTPLNGVIGMTSLLLETPLAGEQREYAETIRRSSDALLAVINDILDFSKIEAGKLELEVLDFDLVAAVEEAVELLAERADAKGLELAILVEPDVPPAVRGDRDRLRQILVNLLANAVKFTDRGEVVVVVQTARDPAGAPLVRFEVTDTGVGIAAEAQARLFASFTQANASTTRTHGGTGLGLAIAKRLVELLGGDIGVDSELGKGATFWFTARLPEASAVDAPDVAEDLSGLDVLVVDDNATNRRILSLTLSRWGMRPATADGAAAALDLLRRAAAAGRPFPLVLLDFLMPTTDGVELARSITADPALRGCRMVLLTSTGHRPPADLTTSAGIAASLAKPVRTAALRECIATVVGHRDAEGRVAAPPGTIAARHPAHVLLVEDNPVNQQVAARMLEKMGHRVDVAGNGLEAVTAVREIPYAAVLMDCQMPEMDGYDATRAIRRLAGRERTPIIAMTASAMETDRRRCLDAGMDDHLAKPVQLVELRDRLDRWLGEAAPVAGGGSAAPDPPPDPPLDPEVLAGLRQLGAESGRDIVHQLTTLFLTTAIETLERIHQALADRDPAALGRAAHAIKGSSATVGAHTLARLSGELERQAGAGDLDGAAATTVRLSAELDRIPAALDA